HRFDALFLFRAAAFLRRIGADILHIHGGCFFYGSIIGRLAGVKGVIHTLHGMPVTSGVQAEWEEYLSCLLTDRIVAVSDEVALDLKARQRAVAGKIGVIINGIDPGKFRPLADPCERADRRRAYGLPADAEIVGSVGRLEKVKNYPLLLRAFAEMSLRRANECHLVLVGKGREEAELKELAQELGIGNRVSFLGLRYDVPDIYPLFDVFALSSLTEGTSLSLLEALSCGVPAIVTDVGGNPRIIDNGVNGYLTPSGDHRAMAAAFGHVLGGAAELSRMKTAARATIVEKFSIHAMLQRYEQIYFAVAGRENGLGQRGGITPPCSATI
ncbi:MAG TPA: glycosyltransferase, partial [Geobacteraceae bacterium]